MLSIKHLKKLIGHATVIHDLSLEVKRGEIAVVLGASGVGKSTLLRILSGIIPADGGVIELDDMPLDGARLRTTHSVGMVFQQFNLFAHLTVEQNITIALERVLHKSNEEARQIARELLERYGLLDKADCMIGQLSGGQKQRLAIARTLALKPTVICFDEPTSALDPLLTSYIAQQIEELAVQGYIIIVTTHSPHLVEKLPCTLYLMREGTIVESAPSAAFFADKQNYEQMAAFMAGVVHEG
jgi:ABC-type polar amino acid transport system ATPase subunit